MKTPTLKTIRYTEAIGAGSTPQEAAEIAGGSPGYLSNALRQDPVLRGYLDKVREAYSESLSAVGQVAVQAILKRLRGKPSDAFLVSILDRFNALMGMSSQIHAPAAPSGNVQVNVGDPDTARRLQDLEAAMKRQAEGFVDTLSTVPSKAKESQFTPEEA